MTSNTTTAARLTPSIPLRPSTMPLGANTSVSHRFARPQVTTAAARRLRMPAAVDPHRVAATAAAGVGTTTKTVLQQSSEHDNVAERLQRAEAAARRALIARFDVGDAFNGFDADVETLRADVADITQLTSHDAAAVQRYVAAVSACVAQRLPVDVLCALRSFLYDQDAPGALLISGFPIDADLPPTPPSRTEATARLPIAESVLLAITDIVGDSYIVARLQETGCRKGLLWDLVADPGPSQALDMHKDYATVAHIGFAPDAILLLGMRPHGGCPVETLLCDNRAVYSVLTEEEWDILRHEQLQCYDVPDEGEKIKLVHNIPHPITGDDENPSINLLGVSVITAHAKNPVWEAQSQRGTEALNKVLHAADDYAAGVVVEPGQLLIINNNKLLHGRSQHETLSDGGHRWLLRTQALQKGKLWSKFARWPTNLAPWPVPLS